MGVVVRIVYGEAWMRPTLVERLGWGLSSHGTSEVSGSLVQGYGEQEDAAAKVITCLDTILVAQCSFIYTRSSSMGRESGRPNKVVTVDVDVAREPRFGSSTRTREAASAYSPLIIASRNNKHVAYPESMM